MSSDLMQQQESLVGEDRFKKLIELFTAIKSARQMTSKEQYDTLNTIDKLSLDLLDWVPTETTKRLQLIMEQTKRAINAVSELDFCPGCGPVPLEHGHITPVSSIDKPYTTRFGRTIKTPVKL